MTLPEKIAQLLWCGWQDDDHAARLIEDLRVGGLILFGRNVRPPAETAAFLSACQARAATPLCVAVDQEGGPVARFALPGLTFPGNMALGALDDPELAAAVGKAIGGQLAGLGINVDFAPVLDVNNNPANPVIGARSFGDRPERVGALGAAMVRGFRRGGVLPVVKHFPGHGDTGVDSHSDLPLQPAGRERLDAVELLPFRAAIAAGAPALMTAHILFPALDPDWPATLSRRILTGLLREELGFDGLVVTDCLEMAGVAARWSPEERACHALAAGADVLLISHDWGTQRRAAEGVRTAVEEGRLPLARVDEAAARVRAAKRDLGLLPPPSRPSTGNLSPPTSNLQPSTSNRQLEAEVAARAITVLSGGERLPLPPGTRVLCCGPGEAVATLSDALVAEGIRTAALAWPAGEPLPAGWDSAPEAELVVWLVPPREPPTEPEARRAALARLRERGPVLVAALGEPYLLAELPEAAARVAIYSPRECSLRGLAAVVSGRAQAEGRLPVALPA